MSRRCAREGIAWPRRANRGEDPVCDPLAQRARSRWYCDSEWFFAEDLAIRDEYRLPDRVGEHLRERAPLP